MSFLASTDPEANPLPLLPARRSGVLLHPSSLPGPGIGSIGAPSRRFVDWLAGAGQSYWQMLPLVPVDMGGSPYNGLSALAGNPLLIDLDELLGEGLLSRSDVEVSTPAAGPIDFDELVPWKEGILHRAYGQFRAGFAPDLEVPFEEYRERHAEWLEDYSLFRALRDRYRARCWIDWGTELAGRAASALAAARREESEAIRYHAFMQFLFDRQWARLRAYAAERGVSLIGDIPIFVAYDSADVWMNPDLFELDADGRPAVVAGVPPDYFAVTGQRWGNPLFRWSRMRETGYAWWIERIRRTLQWVDLVRIDHFRGFESYWEIPAAEETALHGQWKVGPGAEFFRAVEVAVGTLPMIAEDLGLITAAVDELREGLHLPGMRVLQFAFDGDPGNPHLPENHPSLAVAYTGTHDNDTALGWWASAGAAERARAEAVLPAVDGGVHWRMVTLAFGSRAWLAIAPVQDLLGLGSEARMNTPGTSSRNWSWRLDERALTPEVAERLLRITRNAGRMASDAGHPRTETR